MSSSSPSTASIGQRSQSSQAQRTAEAKAAFTASLKSAGAAIDSDLQARAKNIHTNAEALTKQEKRLEKEINVLSRQNDTMQKFVDKSKKDSPSTDELSQALAALEADLALIEDTLDYAEEEDYSSASDNEVDSTHPGK